MHCPKPSPDEARASSYHADDGPASSAQLGPPGLALVGQTCSVLLAAACGKQILGWAESARASMGPSFDDCMPRRSPSKSCTRRRSPCHRSPSPSTSAEPPNCASAARSEDCSATSSRCPEEPGRRRAAPPSWMPSPPVEALAIRSDGCAMGETSSTSRPEAILGKRDCSSTEYGP
jgi:hypothetical protein